MRSNGGQSLLPSPVWTRLPTVSFMHLSISRWGTPSKSQHSSEACDGAMPPDLRVFLLFVTKASSEELVNCRYYNAVTHDIVDILDSGCEGGIVSCYYQALFLTFGDPGVTLRDVSMHSIKGLRLL
jgi:hypothetical protein